MPNSVYDFKVTDIKGQEVSLEQYKGKAMLIVNTASKCGFTPQYTGLQELYKEYQDKNLVVLGFPCNQFGSQEPGTEADIEQFCQVNYGVEFPLFAKVDVNGSNAHPLFQYLKKEAPGLLGSQDVKWNFTKFLVDKYGQVVKRYAPSDSPEKVAEEIKHHI